MELKFNKKRHLESNHLDEDYQHLISTYSYLEIYKEIIHFLNWFYPKWDTHAELGNFAAEFVYYTILNTEWINTPMKHQDLLDVYTEIYHQYPITKEKYQCCFELEAIQEFNRNEEEELDILTDKEYEIYLKAYIASKRESKAYIFY